MPVGTRRIPMYARLTMVGLVALTLLPVCVMLACTSACGCAQCASHPMEAGACPETPTTMLKVFTTLVDPLVLAFAALVAAFNAVALAFEGRVSAVAIRPLVMDVPGPPDPRFSRLLI